MPYPNRSTHTSLISYIIVRSRVPLVHLGRVLSLNDGAVLCHCFASYASTTQMVLCSRHEQALFRRFVAKQCDESTKSNKFSTNISKMIGQVILLLQIGVLVCMDGEQWALMLQCARSQWVGRCETEKLASSVKIKIVETARINITNFERDHIYWMGDREPRRTGKVELLQQNCLVWQHSMPKCAIWTDNLCQYNTSCGSLIWLLRLEETMARIAHANGVEKRL